MRYNEVGEVIIFYELFKKLMILCGNFYYCTIWQVQYQIISVTVYYTVRAINGNSSHITKMIVYLDQNKWIELARIINGIETSEKATALLQELDIALSAGYVFPLSAIHIMEFSRIKNAGRRSRLGKVMWKISQGHTLAPQSEIVCREIEIAFSEMGLSVKPRKLNLIDRGIPHAFGEVIDSHISALFGDEIDEAMIAGNEILNIDPVHFSSQEHKENFSNHLSSLKRLKYELPKSKWENWLYFIGMKDITRPLYDVMCKHKIPNTMLGDWGEHEFKEFMNRIPTRKLDIHLHRQVLRNDQYKSKISDLEDWAGLGIAMCYCDLVICENHFADLVSRGNYKTKARVATSIYDLFPKFRQP